MSRVRRVYAGKRDSASRQNLIGDVANAVINVEGNAVYLDGALTVPPPDLITELLRTAITINVGRATGSADTFEMGTIAKVVNVSSADDDEAILDEDRLYMVEKFDSSDYHAHNFCIMADKIAADSDIVKAVVSGTFVCQMTDLTTTTGLDEMAVLRYDHETNSDTLLRDFGLGLGDVLWTNSAKTWAIGRFPSINTGCNIAKVISKNDSAGTLQVKWQKLDPSNGNPSNVGDEVKVWFINEP